MTPQSPQDGSGGAEGGSGVHGEGSEAQAGAQGVEFAPLDEVMRVVDEQMAKWKTTLDWLADR